MLKEITLKKNRICDDEETYYIVKKTIKKEMCPFVKDSPQLLL